VVEVGLAAWVMSGMDPGACAVAQIALLIVLNANGLLWARHIIHDPAGMVIKNIASWCWFGRVARCTREPNALGCGTAGPSEWTEAAAVRPHV